MLSPGFKLLLVDDDPDDRFIIDEAFVSIGYEAEVKKFVDGDHFFHYLEQIEPGQYPALIVLDSVLPRQDAGDILGILKQDPRYSAITVIVYSTEISPQRKDRLIAQGAFACIKKGATMDEVIAVAKAFRSAAESDNTDVDFLSA